MYGVSTQRPGWECYSTGRVEGRIAQLRKARNGSAHSMLPNLPAR